MYMYPVGCGMNQGHSKVQEELSTIVDWFHHSLTKMYRLITEPSHMTQMVEQGLRRDQVV